MVTATSPSNLFPRFEATGLSPKALADVARIALATVH
jgi:hypothetical protein